MKPLLPIATLIIGSVSLGFFAGMGTQRVTDEDMVAQVLQSSTRSISDNVRQAAARLDVCEEQVRAVHVELDKQCVPGTVYVCRESVNFDHPVLSK